MGIFLTGSLVQTIILINNENYGFPAYQGSLLALAVLAICYLANVYGAKTLPYWQNAVFLLHILAYFAYIVPIWVSAPAATHYQVWGEFQNEGGWSNMALAILVGQLTGISEQVGIDTVSNRLLIPWRFPANNLTDSPHGRRSQRRRQNHPPNHDGRLCPQHRPPLPCLQ
jgi:choline transport protein